MDRTTDNLLLAARLLCFPNNFAFLPHRRVIPSSVAPPPKGSPLVTVDGAEHWVTAQLTLCNCGAVCFCACFGAELPPMKANELWGWLKSNEAKMLGWSFQPDRDIARQRILQGSVFVFVAQNTAGHGHIAGGVPFPLKPNELHVTAAGAQNYVTATLEKSFGHLAASALAFEHLLKTPAA